MPKTFLNLSSLDGATGFQTNGVDTGDYSGGCVASAGDVNGERVDDIIVGASIADPDGTDDASKNCI